MFKIRIEKFNTRFQILSELSAWNNYFCSPKTKSLWIEQSGGPLSVQESKALGALATILKNSQNNIVENLFSRLTAN